MVKDFVGKLMASAQGVMGMFAGDEVMKGVLANYAFEHLEIASYRILVAAAEHVGDQETAAVCREILLEEEAMAAWLLERIEPTTRQYLVREDMEVGTAKR